MKKFYNVPIIVEFKPKLTEVDKLIKGESVEVEQEIEIFIRERYVRFDDIMSFYFLGRNDKGNNCGHDVVVVCSESMGILWIALPFVDVVKMIDESMECKIVE